MDERQPLLQKLQREVEDVQVIVEHNVKRAINERGELFEELDQRADELRKSSMIFEKTTRSVKENMESNDKSLSTRKWKVIGSIVGVVLLVIIIIILATTLKSE